MKLAPGLGNRKRGPASGAGARRQRCLFKTEKVTSSGSSRKAPAAAALVERVSVTGAVITAAAEKRERRDETITQKGQYYIRDMMLSSLSVMMKQG